MNLKLCVVGERAVGKTSLIERYAANRYTPGYTGTLGAQMHPIEAEVPVADGGVVLTKVAIFDLMGEHSVRESFRDALFYGTHGVLAVCDIERPETLYAVADWVRTVSLVTSGVPFTIAFNKADRAGGMSVGPRETAWLREEFPLAPTVLTSAVTGEGVEDAFSGLILRAVDACMEEIRNRARANVLRHRILLFVATRESIGASKTELFANFRDTRPPLIMEELDHLVRLDLLTEDAAGPSSFVKSEQAPAFVRFRTTPAGRKLAESPNVDQLVVYESA